MFFFFFDDFPVKNFNFTDSKKKKMTINCDQSFD